TSFAEYWALLSP
nr:Chain B, 12-mer peptide inhibitor [synthetic construct]3LNZ_D Chain D, 12-mer peptide inhibitor [synthetic construct]3LNZ_F Chain F, 12-mer peptide inhibitor [synthetic construct]3LNZ_H Chain H, 12-mer peptide inhibitor [synthetic construct]3LNZ_J Chain J, 12-mer peptide inhibitor [synthetic construct]3LNZ_L Chain L, 12-mer peptide inhibitor [synthetic construct]3LNZ_N Chain N, 12-mer peptide inhibitor [synthetic construct]3LNZ_P Chain P, 12-mer peptide inhibitor [synthetic construct]